MNALPNYLSALRIVLVIPIAWLLWQQQVMSAFWLCCLRGCPMRWMDSWRALRLADRVGIVLDPLADKFLVAAVSGLHAAD